MDKKQIEKEKIAKEWWDKILNSDEDIWNEEIFSNLNEADIEKLKKDIEEIEKKLQEKATSNKEIDKESFFLRRKRRIKLILMEAIDCVRNWNNWSEEEKVK